MERAPARVRAALVAWAVGVNFMAPYRWTTCLFAILALVLSTLGVPRVEAGDGTARHAKLQSSVSLSQPRTLAADDDTLTCFDGSQAALVNPGCFSTSAPSQSGDCTSSSAHYFVQYLFPQPSSLKRVRGFSFLSNDADTVFPSAGALLLPIENGSVRFPTAAELGQLQRTNVSAAGDTSQVFVDLRSAGIVVGPTTDAALVLVLQFPDGGQLVSETQGPGVAVESSTPDNDCDFFTIDGGTSGTWFSPVYDPNNPSSLPLEWGFVAVLEPLSVRTDGVSWSWIKETYRGTGSATKPRRRLQK